MRTRQVLMETFNKAPRPECAIQNQLLLLEVLCDIRDAVQKPIYELKFNSPDAEGGVIAPFDDEPEQKPLKPVKPIDEPI